ncbi:MAG: DMT family transporter [Bacteroidales bacterium]|nr:DMT family transporter [Bacteroidales bacterium]
MTKNKKSTLLALLAVLLWSTVATAFKISLKELHFIHVLAIATYTSAIIFFIFLIIKKQFLLIFQMSSHQWLISAFSGLLNPFSYYIVLLSAYSMLPAFMAQPLNYTWPVVLVIFSAWLLKQKLQKRAIVAFILSLAGVFFISLSKTPSTSTSSANFVGILLATGSSIIWSLYWIVNIKDHRSALIKLFLNFLFGSFYISLLILILDKPFPHWNASYIAAIYTGLFEMGITFLLWLTALNTASRTDKISIYIFLSPFLSLFFISTILQEKITLWAIIGFICIATGIIFLKWKEIFFYEKQEQ